MCSLILSCSLKMLPPPSWIAQSPDQCRTNLFFLSYPVSGILFIAAQDGRPTPMAMLRISISVVLSDSHLEVSTRDVKWYFLHVLSHMLCSGLLFVIMKYPFLAHTHTPVTPLSPFTASGPPLPRLCPNTQWPCASLSMSPGIPTYTNVKIRC